MNGDTVQLIVIYAIAILAVIIVLLTSFYPTTQKSQYGTYTSVVGKCIPALNTVSDELCGMGVQTVDEVCTPHPTTGKGCLRDGEVTYATYRSHKECKVYCVKSKWSEPVESECVNTLSSVLTTEGVKTITKTCVDVNPSGVNNCYIETGDSGVIYYNIGDVYTSTTTCQTNKHFNGEWVFLDPVKYAHLPRDVFISSEDITFTDVNNGLYKISSKCISNGILEAGYMNNIAACKIGNEVIIPQDQYAKDGEAYAYCSQPHIPSSSPCRYLPLGYKYYNVKTEGGAYIVVRQLPGSLGNRIPFRSNVKPGYHIQYPDVELMLYTFTSSNETITNTCTIDETIRDTAAQFLFIPSHDGIGYKVGIIAYSGYPGFLDVDNGRAMWTQAKLGPDTPGINLSQAKTFNVILSPSSSQHIDINITISYNGKYLRTRNVVNSKQTKLKNLIGIGHDVSDRSVSKECTLQYIQ